MVASMAVVCTYPKKGILLTGRKTFAKYAQLLMFSCDGIKAYTNGYAHLYLKCDICQIFDDNLLLNSVRFE